MDKNYLKDNAIIIFLAILIVIGFLIYGDKNIFVKRADQSKESSQQKYFFDKKVECQNYKEKINKEIGLAGTNEVLYRIIYSSKRNSCISAKYILHSSGEGESLEVKDILSDEIIYLNFYKNSIKYWDAEAELDEKLKELE